MHETCRRYVDRRLSEGWKVVSQRGNYLILSTPDGSMLRTVDLRNDVETLRPNAAGDETNIGYEYPETEPHYTLVDEVTPDALATYVGSYIAEAWERDLYNLSASAGSGTINKITVYARCIKDAGTSKVKIVIKAGTGTGAPDTISEGPEQNLTEGWVNYFEEWTYNPSTIEHWTWAEVDRLQAGISMYYEGSAYNYCTQVYVEVDYTTVVAPTVTTQAASSVQATTATGNGNITATGGENCDHRGIVYGKTSKGDPGNVAPGSSGYDGYEDEADGFGTGAFTRSLSSLDEGTTYYARAYAHNSAGYAYGAEVSFLTKPAAPTGVEAYDGYSYAYVRIVWTKSTGATSYQVYRDGTPLGWIGDVATYDDTGAGAPSITPGEAAASDGLYADKVALSLSGQSANNGATHTYKVRAKNATGESVDSGTNTGYRGVGSLTYQWQRSAADSDADYSNIAGATTESYDDTGAPADGSGRYYRCVENATGAAQQISAVDRGYRAALTDIGTRFTLWVRGLKDIPTRFKSTVQNYRDATTRFQLVITKDIASRFKLTVQAYQDITTRFKLRVQGFTDIATRFRLVVQAYQDIATRFLLTVQGYKDITTRFRLIVQNYRDITTRFRLFVQNYQGTATRFILNVKNYQDIATRFKLSVQNYQDVSTRFFLCQPTWEEIQIQKAVTNLAMKIAELEVGPEPKAHFRI